MVRYAGLDVHKKKCHGVIMAEDGKVLEDEEFEKSLLGVEHFFQGCQDAQVVIEVSYSWRPTYERLEEMGFEVKLAHPRKTRVIADKKVKKMDHRVCKALAKLLRVDWIPEAYGPP